MAALTALLSYDYYFVGKPYTLELNSPADAVALVVFLLVALLTGTIVYQLDAHRTRERRMTEAVTLLLAAVQALSECTDVETMKRELVVHLARAVEGVAFVRDQKGLYGDQTGEELPAEVEARAAKVLAGEGQSYFTAGWTINAIRANGRTYGAVLWRPAHRRLIPPARQAILRILADFAAEAMARADASTVKAAA